MGIQPCTTPATLLSVFFFIFLHILRILKNDVVHPGRIPQIFFFGIGALVSLGENEAKSGDKLGVLPNGWAFHFFSGVYVLSIPNNLLCILR